MANIDAAKVEQYTNALLTAAKIQIEHEVQDLEFNKTELAEIVDITKRDQGVYTV